MKSLNKVLALIKKYFPDVWQYLIVIIIMIIAGLFIL